MLLATAAYEVPSIIVQEALTIYLAGVAPHYLCRHTSLLSPVCMDMVAFFITDSLEKAVNDNPTLMRSVLPISKLAVI